MHEDKFFKELLKSGAESTSGDFTADVMSRIQAIQATNAYNSSIISNWWKLVFKIAFVALSVAIIIVSFIINPLEIPSTIFSIDKKTAFQIVLYILSFWVFVFINQYLLNRNFQKST